MSLPRLVALGGVLLLASCKPPAADNYVARIAVPERMAPMAPIDSPDTQGAVWAKSTLASERLVYGKPGQPPLMALACMKQPGKSVIEYTRFVETDPHAQAVLALIGNGHVARLKIDAQRQGKVWLWQGRIDPHSPHLEVLTGARSVEATVPGAGTVTLNPSPLPEELIRQCREQSAKPATPVGQE